MRNHFERAVTNVKDRVTVNDVVTAQTARIENSTAWRVDGTLREFAKFKPRNIWFSYPTHTVDESGVLADIQLDDNTPSWKKNFDKKQSPAQRKADRKTAFETAYSAFDDGVAPVKADAICEYLGISSRTLKRRIEEVGGYKLDGNIIVKE